MNRIFFSTFEFDKQWESLGFGDEDRRRLENEISSNPKAGKIIRGTGGLRKIRYAPEGQGKSGGSRVLFVDYVVYDRVYLITAYSKKQKVDISSDERKAYKRAIEQGRKGLKQ